MDEYRDQEQKGFPEGEGASGNEMTRQVPATREPEQTEAPAEQAPRRRRRSERYALPEEAESQEPQDTTVRISSAPVNESEAAAREAAERAALRGHPEDTSRGGETATAREAAERMGLRNHTEEGPDPLAGARIPPQAAAWNRARAAEGATSRKGMSEAARVRMAGAQRERGEGTYTRGSENVGYAGGRMNESNPAMAAAARARIEAQRAAGSPSPYRGENGRGPVKSPLYPEENEKKRKPKGLIIALIVLLILGALIVGLLLVPEDAPGFPGDIKRAVSGLLGGGRQEEKTNGVLTFSASGYENAVAPTDVTFAVQAEKNVTDLQLTDESGEVIPCSRMTGNNTDQNLWTLTWHLEDGYEGAVKLQVMIDGEWKDTDRKIEVSVASLPQISDVPTGVDGESVTTPEPEAAGDAQQPLNNLQGTAEATPPQDLPGIEPEDIPPEDLTGENPEENGEGEGVGEGTDEGPGEDGWYTAEGGEGAGDWDPEAGTAMNNLPKETEPPAEEPEEGGEEASEPEETPEPEATPEPTEEAKLVVTACEQADPSGLITQAVIYNGTKKAAEYARAAKELVAMPGPGEYTKVPMGILTYRGDAFRQNASCGNVSGATGLSVAWTVDAGYVKGSGQNYYGIGWTGQPAIVKWSKEVREQTEKMYESKKEKTGLKEVIVGGLDGNIYFLDLADGSVTRDSIKLRYPMKGSASVHPGGAPYMTIGQYARKMASGTGKIGLRQYNLYTSKELTLLDGLDGKYRRAFNDIGSFETSALIDRTSGTMVTAGTNGLLYVISLNSTFDYQMGNYSQSPEQVILKTKAKGEKDSDTAVEASVAMYDRYVFYADMGGVLRCVDTNSMTTTWAVQLTDAVESTPALDFNGDTGLDLYTATTLTAKKKGDVDICCYDALTGAMKWVTSFEVAKDTKNKTVSGFRASPVVGQNSLSEMVYYTVNNLSEDGRDKLGIGEQTAAIIALNKRTGKVEWSRGLTGRGYSSPVAVYDESGNGWIIQCAGDGSILLMEGLTGKVVGSLEVEGAIEASPAVYNDMMVIGTTQKGSNYIYGIRIE